MRKTVIYILNFNPRAPVGRDHTKHMGRFCVVVYFNPRAPVGRDPATKLSWVYCENFNPRAPVGRDRNILYHLLRLYIFNNNFDSINSEKKLFFYYFLLESYIKKCVTQVL